LPSPKPSRCGQLAVAVDRHVADRYVGRVKLCFYAGEYLDQMAAQERQVDIGRVRLGRRPWSTSSSIPTTPAD
jgi:hypothetical protein